MKRFLSLASSSSSGSAARPASGPTHSNCSGAKRPVLNTVVLNHVSITTLRGVQLWLAQEHIATCTRNTSLLRIQEAVAVLSRPKLTKDNLKPLQLEWRVSRTDGKKHRPSADIIGEFKVKIIEAAQKLQQQLTESA